MIVAEATAEGGRRPNLDRRHGCLPDLALAKARGAGADVRLEFHVHLLARSRAERTAAISDLSHLDRN